jgi:hypothetical protein
MASEWISKDGQSNFNQSCKELWLFETIIGKK